MDEHYWDTVKSRVKRHEGCRLEAYRCSEGHWTIGYGHRLDKDADGMFIPYDVAEELFDEDIGVAFEDAQTLLPEKVWNELPLTAQGILVEMCFQLGRRGTGNFVKMLEALKYGEYQVAADEMMDSKWAKQTPNRARTLAILMTTAEGEKDE